MKGNEQVVGILNQVLRKVLVDSGKFFAENLIENADDLFIPLHVVAPFDIERLSRFNKFQRPAPPTVTVNKVALFCLPTATNIVLSSLLYANRVLPLRRLIFGCQPRAGISFL